MALNLQQIEVGSIVDRVSEWGEDGKERPLPVIQRGIIVKVDGDPQQESVDGIYVCFGPETKKDMDVEINDQSVPAQKIQARELVEYRPAQSLVAKEAWRRLFRIPTNVGVVWENRKAKGGRKRKVADPLALTATMGEGVVKDDPTPGGMKMLPEEEA
jgi:hypothetical protein